jgi:large subunit ribosomal protein L22
MLEARAINRYVNSSPRKMRLVIDLIRGKDVSDALSILHFSPKHASKVAEKVLRSAVSNLQNKDEAGRVGPETLFVKEAFVDGGPSLKRMLPAPMGRAYRLIKRSNHITIVVAQREEKVKPTSKQKEKRPAKKSSKSQKQE